MLTLAEMRESVREPDPELQLLTVSVCLCPLISPADFQPARSLNTGVSSILLSYFKGTHFLGSNTIAHIDVASLFLLTLWPLYSPRSLLSVSYAYKLLS